MFCLIRLKENTLNISLKILHFEACAQTKVELFNNQPNVHLIVIKKTIANMISLTRTVKRH